METLLSNIKSQRETVLFPCDLICQILPALVYFKKFKQCALLCVAGQGDTEKTIMHLRMKTKSPDSLASLRPSVLPRRALVWKLGGERTRFL